jgi:hypothetical protein
MSMKHLSKVIEQKDDALAEHAMTNSEAQMSGTFKHPPLWWVS